MQPSTVTNKPVMDVAAPRGPVAAASPYSQPPAPAPVAATPAAQSAELPVRTAPLAEPGSRPKAAATPDLQPAMSRRPDKAGAAQAAVAHRAPVALITVTVFVMLVLSALAVTVYMTSQTA